MELQLIAGGEPFFPCKNKPKNAIISKRTKEYVHYKEQ
jgi:hypothetical protein